MPMVGSVRSLSDTSRVQPEKPWMQTVAIAESGMVEDREQDTPTNASEDLTHQEHSFIAGGNVKWKRVGSFLQN